MSELYYGTIGKGKSWGLLADKRIVVYKKKTPTSEFIPVDTIAEAEKLYSGMEDVVYFWDQGDWQEVHFLVQAGERKPAIGFISK
jgi:hypothetical protein